MAIFQHEALLEKYVDAKDYIINEGYVAEIDWQSGLNFDSTSESDFLRESAWVILSSGMRETVIRKKFEDIEASFLKFISAKDIVLNADECREKAISEFSHDKKIDAIISLSTRVVVDGFDIVKKQIKHYGIRYLQSFDFIGPATSYHLAKNLGLCVSKPDRHLCRVADVTGFESVEVLCDTLSDCTGDSASVVDLVIWRFATLNSDYVSWFRIKE